MDENAWLAEKLFPVLGLPSGWIVDPMGRRSSIIRLSTADRILAELEKAAAGK